MEAEQVLVFFVLTNSLESHLDYLLPVNQDVLSKQLRFSLSLMLSTVFKGSKPGL